MPLFLKAFFCSQNGIKPEYGIALLLSAFILAVTLISQSWNNFVSIADQTIQSIPSAHTQLAQVDGPSSFFSFAYAQDQNSSGQLAQGLIGWWKFDEGSGTTAGDSSGGGNNGTLMNGAVWTSDSKVGGGAISLDGVDDYVSIVSNPVSSFSNPISVCAWVLNNNPTINGTGDFDQTILKLYGDASNSLRFFDSVTSRKLVFAYKSGGVNTSIISSSAVFIQNQWTHVCYTYNGTNKILYANGATVSSIAGPTYYSYGVGNYIGTMTSTGGNWGGKVDDVRIYNRALSAMEVTDLYNLGNGGTTPPSTPTNGSCGTTVNSCTSGTLQDIADSETQYFWNCNGSNGGANASCSLPITTIPDTTPPVISSIQSTSITQTGATIAYIIKQDGTGNFTTIQACANVAKAGDTCLVYSGSYNENVIPKNSGVAGAPITYKISGTTGTVIMKGFSLTNINYITIQGFEITNSPSTGTAISLKSTNRVQILDNYIHDIVGVGHAILFDSNMPSNYAIIRNNAIAWSTKPRYSTYGGTQGRGIRIEGNNNLIESNNISHTGSFIFLWGQYNVVRNNEFHDNYLSDFNPVDPTTPDDHMDGVAYGSYDGTPFKRNLVENNYMHDSPDRDVKFLLFRDLSLNGISDLIVRYNIISHIGSYFGIIGDNVTDFRIYNNTTYKIGEGNVAAGVSANWYTINFTKNSTGGKLINNIFYDIARPEGSRGYYVDSSSQTGFYANNNLGYETVRNQNFQWLSPIVNEPNAVLGKDPLLSDQNNGDFTLREDSPAIDKGGSLTKVSASDSGSGTNLVVNDAGFFQDGWAGVNPDWIAVGTTNNIVQISSINYNINTITLASSISRNDNDLVWLYRDSSGRQVLYGSAPDIGAYEYVGGRVVQPPIISPTPITGDFNSDGLVNSIDLSLMITVWNTNNITYDLNKDGRVNSLDYVVMVRNWTI